MRNLTKPQSSTSLLSTILDSIKSIFRNLFGITQPEENNYTETNTIDEEEYGDPKSNRPKVAQVAVVVSTQGPIEEEDDLLIDSTTITLAVNGTYNSFSYTVKLQFSGSHYTLPGSPTISHPTSDTTAVTYAVSGAPLSTDKSATTTDVYLDNVLEPDNTGVSFSYTVQG